MAITDQKVVKPDLEDLRETSSLQNSYAQNMGTYNRLDDRPPYDGMIDRLGEVRLRLAVIDNPEMHRNKYENIDPLNIKNIINLSNGKIVLRWLDMPGGVIRSTETGGEWTYKKENDKINPEQREYNDWDIKSQREMVSLTHPFIWANAENYCGFNYIPPVGSVVVVGFRKLGFPILLGFIPTHYKICYPVLKPGEMVMKGYGNNYTHWRWADKIDMKAWAFKGGSDIDDPNTRDGVKPKINELNCTLWLRLNANDRFIQLLTIESDTNDAGETIESYDTELKITPKELSINTNHVVKGADPVNTNLKINPESITMNTGAFTINANTINLTSKADTIVSAGNITLTSASAVTITSVADTTFSAGGNYTVSATLIKLN